MEFEKRPNFIKYLRYVSNKFFLELFFQKKIKSLLDPNSSIDLEDFCINKIPKKGRPRTRELKEPKVPKNKDLKEQKELKSKVSPGPKSPFKLLPKKALGNITSDKKSSVPYSLSNPLTANSASIQVYEVKEEYQLMNRLTECGNVPIISATNSPKLIMKKRPINKISGKPDYYDQSDLSSINEVSEKSDTDIDIVASMECSQTFSTYASGGGFANGKRSDSSGTLDSACSGSVSSGESVKSSDDGSYDNYSVLRRSRSNGGHTTNMNANGTCVGGGVHSNCDAFNGMIDMNMSIGSMTSMNGGGGVLSNQTIDEVSILMKISVMNVSF